MDKKKQSFDTSGFQSVVVKDIPQQMNGSDCGMFTCKVSTFAAKIWLQQNHLTCERGISYY